MPDASVELMEAWIRSRHATEQTTTPALCMCVCMCLCLRVCGCLVMFKVKPMSMSHNIVHLHGKNR